MEGKGSYVREWRRKYKFYNKFLHLHPKDFAFLKKWLEKKTNKYVSHDLQNEILSLMSDTVVWNIIDELKSGERRFYSVIADEYTEASDLEQLRMWFSWLDNDLHVHKDFIRF